MRLPIFEPSHLKLAFHRGTAKRYQGAIIMHQRIHNPNGLFRTESIQFSSNSDWPLLNRLHSDRLRFKIQIAPQSDPDLFRLTKNLI